MARRLQWRMSQLDFRGHIWDRLPCIFGLAPTVSEAFARPTGHASRLDANRPPLNSEKGEAPGGYTLSWEFKVGPSGGLRAKVQPAWRVTPGGTHRMDAKQVNGNAPAAPPSVCRKKIPSNDRAARQRRRAATDFERQTGFRRRAKYKQQRWVVDAIVANLDRTSAGAFNGPWPERVELEVEEDHASQCAASPICVSERPEMRVPLLRKFERAKQSPRCIF